MFFDDWMGKKPIEYLNHGILVVKKNELIHTTTLINLQGIMLSEKKVISLRWYTVSPFYNIFELIKF